MCDSSWLTHFRNYGLSSVQEELNRTEVKLYNANEMCSVLWEFPVDSVWKMECFVHRITRPKNAFNYKKPNGTQIYAADRYARMLVGM
jgi:hypothetical protein